jgi:mono/diheme cytochrome c family protein
LLVALGASGCNGERAPLPAASTAASVVASAAPATPSASAVPVAASAGDVARGRELARRFECSRCHDGTELKAASQEKHCTHCHQDILAGRFAAGAAALPRWKKTVLAYRDVPSLAGAGRLRSEWIEAFLLEPRDLRPHLVSTMPRLRITRDEARDIVAWLRHGASPLGALSLGDASAESGRRLLESKGCGSCHLMGGVPPLPTLPDPKLGDERTRRGVMLAPDLRHTRERWAPAELVAWLRDPQKLRPGTLMPATGFSDPEARDVARYVLTAELAPAAPAAVPKRLPPLERKVTWDEVDRRVFHVTCRHCHAEPDYALGDGGPGNTGGFGFAPRGVNLASYEGVAAGWLDEKGERRSLFKPDASPRLLAALLARQHEVAGEPGGELRGMPLGLPALSAEDVQLVESWIAQGRPR